MANDINSAFRTEVLSINDQIYIMEGDFNPSEGAGQTATKGSLFMQRDTTELFKKVGPLDTDWAIVASNDAATIFATMSEPTGHVNRVDSEISFDVGTRTFTIQPRAPATEYDYYIKGVKHTINVAKTFVVPDVSGPSFIYFDENEVLQSATEFTYDLLSIYAYCAIIQWNTAQQRVIYFGDERHGITMDGQTHMYLHSTVGTQFIEGLTINGTLNPEVGTPTDADVQLDISNGKIRDEDLEHHIVDTGTGLHVYDLEQNLSPVAQVPVLWKTGANGDWNISAATNFPFLYSDGINFTGANGRPPWNQYTGATWQLTEIGNNRYFMVHILATNDAKTPVVAIQGTAEYQNKPAGRDAAVSELSQLTGLPFEEYFPLASLILESRDTYTNTPKVRVRSTEDGEDFVDWRYTDSFVFKVIGGGVNDHGNLTGLTDDGHPHYALSGSGSTRTFDFGDLNDIQDFVTPTNGDSYMLVWDTGNTRYNISELTLESLNDTNITNGPAIDEYMLTYNDTTGNWEAIVPPYIALQEEVNRFEDATGMVNPNGSIDHDKINLTLSNVDSLDSSSTFLEALLQLDTAITNNVNENSFETISVSGQNDVVADTSTDTLTLASGTGISITTDDATDTITITATGGVGSDEQVKVTTNDTTAGFLNDSIFAGTGISTSVLNPSADETLQISLNANLDDITNVIYSGVPASGEVLTFNGSNWENQAGTTISNFASVVVGLTATSAIPITWTNVSWTTTHVENNTAVIEHDNTNTDRILIKETGLYILAFSMSFDADAGEEIIEARVLIDDTTVVPGSLRRASEDDEINDLSNTITAELTAGTYLTFQNQASGAGNLIDSTSNLMVTRASGIKGEQGPAGSGTTITVQEEGTTVSGGPYDTLNFIGDNVTATNAGSGVATITVDSKQVFHAHNNTTTQTLTTTFVTAIIGTDIRSDAIYSNTNGEVTINKTANFEVAYEISGNSTGQRSSMECVLQIDTGGGFADVPGTFSYGYHRSSANGEDTAGATSVLTVASGDIVRVRIREITGGIVTISNACRLTIKEID